MIIKKSRISFLEEKVFHNHLKPRQILMYKTENPKRKIYYNLENDTWGYIVDTEKYATASAGAVVSVISYILFRMIDTTVFNYDPLVMYVVLSFLGIILGSLLVFFKNRNAKGITLKPLKKKEALEDILLLANEQYKANFGMIYLFTVTIIFSVFDVVIVKDTVVLMLIIPLWTIIIYLIDYFDFFRRKRLYKYFSNIVKESSNQ
ncbi:hypothetical protein [Enterococcus sp. AZ109]|uniref:hypothetical protein n=1 Tax=Enterococcus sp. AZ109 TaxID=2774634 RepID=UPI003F220F40